MTAAVAAPALSKFTLYNFYGDPIAYYLVTEATPPKPVLTSEPTDYIVVVDASGSMYGVMRETRAMVEKVLTVEEFNNDKMRVTLISYSSRGDVIVHFERVTVAEIMKPGSRYVEDIRRIEARGMTCASQAFALALTIAAKASGTVGIAVHTDGFFNDPSPIEEARSFDKLIVEASKMKNVFVNTIAYGWADYSIMSKIANALSGKCIKATTVKDVYTALHDTQALLAGRVVAASTSPIEDADYQLSLNVSQRKVNGTTTDLKIQGVNGDDNFKVYRFRNVSKAVFDKASGKGAEHGAIYAFARAKLAEGKLNDAKYALASTCNATLLERHAKALTNEQLTAFALDLEEAMFKAEMRDYVYSPRPGLENANKPALTKIFERLNRSTDGFTVDLTVLANGYVRQGVRKVSGTWSHEAVATTDADSQVKALSSSTFDPCPFYLAPDDDPTMVSTGGFSINNAEATINLLLTRPAKLMKDKKTIRSVAGIPLKNLTKFNNYTIVGSGNTNVEVLPLRISDVTLYNDLVTVGVLPSVPFNPLLLYRIPLKAFPTVAFNQQFGDIPVYLVSQMALCKHLISLCDAILKVRMEPEAAAPEAVASGWTAEQEEQLKAHYITPALYFSPPSRDPYKSKDEAIAKGWIDQRTRYSISVGDTELLDMSDVPSANAFFGRRFADMRDPKKPAKVTIADLFNTAAVIEAKPTGKMKLGYADNLLFEHYAVLTGEASSTVTAGVMKSMITLGVPKADADAFLNFESLATCQAAATKVRRALSAEQEDAYEQYVRPLAFYIGASGLVPDGWNVEVMDNTALTAKFPTLKGSPKETYLRAGTTIITLAAASVDVLTDDGLAEVKRLTGEADDEE
jgi:hypothetical protein